MTERWDFLYLEQKMIDSFERAWSTVIQKSAQRDDPKQKDPKQQNGDAKPKHRRQEPKDSKPNKKPKKQVDGLLSQALRTKTKFHSITGQALAFTAQVAIHRVIRKAPREAQGRPPESPSEPQYSLSYIS